MEATRRSLRTSASGHSPQLRHVSGDSAKPEYRALAIEPALLDARPTARIVLPVPAIPRAAILAGRHQAVRPWCLLTQDIATTSKECSHGGERIAPTDAPCLFRDPARGPGRLLAQHRPRVSAQGRRWLQQSCCRRSRSTARSSAARLPRAKNRRIP